jgi:hypothetical protein
MHLHAPKHLHNRVSVFDKYLHQPHVNILKIIYMPTM